MKNFSQFLVSALLLIGATSVSANESSSMMDKLLILTGEWDMTVSSSPDKGKTWQKAPTTRVGLALTHKNKLLKEIPLEHNKRGFNMETYLTWDQYRKSYRKAAIDDVWGVMDIYEGSIQGNYLVMDNLKAGTSFPVGDNKWRHFRLKIELAKPSREMVIEASDDQGKSWFPSFIAHYQLIES